MATGLSALTSLEYFRLEYDYPPPRPSIENRSPPPRPLTRFDLLSLTKIRFKGASEYLEEILARIDAPRLNELLITFFNQIIFNTPQLFQLISRRPTLSALEKGHILFDHRLVIVKFPSQISNNNRVLSVAIPCTALEWRISSLEQVCTTSLPPVSTLEDLYIYEGSSMRPRWQNNVENTLWLELLRPFAAMKNLYLDERIAERITPALQELVGARTTEVLPTLENIFLKRPQVGPSILFQEGIEKFFAARQLTNRPVTVSRWDGMPHWF